MFTIQGIIILQQLKYTYNAQICRLANIYFNEVKKLFYM